MPKKRLYDPEIQLNPFIDSNETEFEDLCRDLFAKNNEVTHARKLFGKGYKQFGGDILIQAASNDTTSFVAQCKHYPTKNFSRADIEDAVNVFATYWESHWQNFDVSKFYLLVARPLTTDDQLFTIQEQRVRLLRDFNIEFVYWDSTDLERELKSYRDLVRDYLGEYWEKKINLSDSDATETAEDLFKQSSANRLLLLQELSRLRIDINPTPSSQTDIEKLEKLSRKNFLRFPEFSSIKVGEKEIVIDRPVSAILKSAAEENSIIVTGDAGAGKSGVLYGFLDKSFKNERDVVFISVDKLESRSQLELKQEFQLEHDFAEVLNEWSGSAPGFLVIDALDAARDQQKTHFLNNLIEDVILAKNRWRVVVSIRRFDLRYNSRLEKLFAGQPVEGFSLPEFPNLRYINISELQPEEIVQVFLQHQDFASLYFAGDSSLQELLRSPFNLNLVGELFAENVKVEELSSIHAQIELLERYWHKRICDSIHNAGDYEPALAKIVELIVNRREMQISRGEIREEIGEKSLIEALHCGVITEGQSSNGKFDGSVIYFSHHILFDYAVARLFLRGRKNALIEKLETDRELVLAIRPSLVFHFQYEFLKGAEHFWAQVYKVYRSKTIPSIGKLIAVSVAVTSAKNIAFFEPFFQKLNGIDAGDKAAGRQILSHISYELRYRSNLLKDNPLIGNLHLWLEFLERLSTRLTPETVYSTRTICWNFIELIPAFDDEKLKRLGVVARRLLDFVLSLPYQDFFLIGNAITFVCRTFATNQEESIKLLRSLITKSRICEYGHRELKFFADEIETLLATDLDFVGEIYFAAFTNTDSSEDRTSFGESRILNFASTRQQDFQHMRLELRTKFGAFLRQAPVQAIQTLIEIFDSYGEQVYIRRLEERKVWYSMVGLSSDEKITPSQIESFIFRGTQARISSDDSRNWSGGVNYRDNETLNLFGAFCDYLEEQCQQKSTKVSEIVSLLAKNNRMAVFWRTIISFGARFPESIGTEIRPLFWALPILVNEDTYRSAAEYLQVNFSRFTEEERILTEQAILSILQPEDKSRNHHVYIRNYLLSHLDIEHVANEKARKIIANLNRIKEKRRRSAQNDSYDLIYEPENLQLNEAKKSSNKKTPFEKNILNPIERFTELQRQNAPHWDEITDFLPLAKSLYNTLDSSAVTDIDQKLAARGWHYLSKFCNLVVENDDLFANADALGFLKEVLLKASFHRDPDSDKDDSLEIDDYPWTTVPFTRGIAGRSLVRLARFEAGATPEIIERIKYLCLSDPVQAVRYYTSFAVNSIYNTAPKLMWEILSQISQDETSFKVLRGISESPFKQLAYEHPNEVFVLTKTVYDRIRENESGSRIKKNCIFIFIKLAFMLNHEKSWQELNAIINAPHTFQEEVWQIVQVAGNSVTTGIDEPHSSKNKLIRNSSFLALENICRQAYKCFESLYLSLSEKDSDCWTEQDKDTYRHLHRLIEQVGLKIYFASGADGRYMTSYEKEFKIPKTDEQRVLFWNESKNVLDALSETGFADVAHRLVETLEHLFHSSPREVFLIFGKTVENGKRDFYQYESMAISNIVALLTEVFGSYSYLVKEHQDVRFITFQQIRDH